MSFHTTTVGGRSASPTAAGMVAKLGGPVKRRKPHGYRILRSVSRLLRASSAASFYDLQAIPTGRLAHYSETATPEVRPNGEPCLRVHLARRGEPRDDGSRNRRRRARAARRRLRRPASRPPAPPGAS